MDLIVNTTLNDFCGVNRACWKSINIINNSDLWLRIDFKVQTNHAESLNCLAYDLLKNALSRYSRDWSMKWLKTKHCLSHTIILCFQQIWGRVCFSVMEQIRSIFYTTSPPWRSLDFRWLLFSSRKKVTNSRMKVRINR